MKQIDIININDSSDKLNIIDDKISFLSNMIINFNIEISYLKKSDLNGFGLILNDLQNEIKEVKKLLNKK